MSRTRSTPRELVIRRTLSSKPSCSVETYGSAAEDGRCRSATTTFAPFHTAMAVAA